MPTAYVVSCSYNHKGNLQAGAGGHSRQTGRDKDFNDQTNALAKAGALHGESLHGKPDLIYISLLIIPCIIYYVTNKETLNLESWTFHALPPNPSVTAVTRRQHATGTHTPASSQIALSPRCRLSPHPPNCGFVNTNYGKSHFRPTNSSHFHL